MVGRSDQNSSSTFDKMPITFPTFKFLRRTKDEQKGAKTADKKGGLLPAISTATALPSSLIAEYNEVQGRLRKALMNSDMSNYEILRTLAMKIFLDHCSYQTFQDNLHLYFVLEYSAGGELFTLIRKAHRLTNEATQNGYIKVCDFGFAKVVEPCTKTWTLCGTPEYLAPEIILNKGHGAAVDWWAVGILIFEMLVGYPPFEADDRLNLYQLILRCEIVFPRHVKKEARDLISGLVTNDLSRRLGNLKNGARDITGHVWYKGFDWEALLSRGLKPPVAVEVKGEDDSSNFDEYDDDEGPDVGATRVTNEDQKRFLDFSLPLDATPPP